MKPAPSLPALFLPTITKLPPQPASFTPHTNSDFVVRDIMNHEENHKENQSDFS